MRTMYDLASTAVLPWKSPDADQNSTTEYADLPQQDIDICLMCQHCASACDKCDGKGNLRRSGGRPAISVDGDLLRRMLRLRKCNREICAALGCSTRTLIRLKKGLEI